MKTGSVAGYELHDENRGASKVRQEPSTCRKEHQVRLATNMQPGVQRTAQNNQANADHQIRNPNHRPGETIQLPFRPKAEQDPRYQCNANSRLDLGLHELSIAS